jgi:CrcB protein
MFMITLLSVAAGGAIGAALRFLVGLGIGLPLGTFAVNVAGSLVMGALAAILLFGDKGPSPLAPFLMTGVLGGFTTFSAFSLDVLRLVESGRFGMAAIYASASFILSIAACAVGLWVARAVMA